FPDRDGPVPASEGLGKQRSRVRIDLRVPQIHELQPNLFGQRPDEIALADQAEVDQHAAERLRRLLVLGEREVQLFLRDQALLQQDLAELLRLALRGYHGVAPSLMRLGDVIRFALALEFRLSVMAAPRDL